MRWEAREARGEERADIHTNPPKRNSVSEHLAESACPWVEAVAGRDGPAYARGLWHAASPARDGLTEDGNSELFTRGEHSNASLAGDSTRAYAGRGRHGEADRTSPLADGGSRWGCDRAELLRWEDVI